MNKAQGGLMEEDNPRFWDAGDTRSAALLLAHAPQPDGESARCAARFAVHRALAPELQILRAELVEWEEGRRQHNKEAVARRIGSGGWRIKAKVDYRKGKAVLGGQWAENVAKTVSSLSFGFVCFRSLDIYSLSPQKISSFFKQTGWEETSGRRKG